MLEKTTKPICIRNP